MKITSYANRVPFWIRIDIDGGGKRWLLAYLTGHGDDRMINFPMEEFEDYWEPEDFAKYEQRLIEQPDEKEEA